MNNKIKGLLVVLIAFLGWYFLLKQSDYTITFKVNAATGTVFQGIQEWSTNQSKKGAETYSTLEKKNFDCIKQEMIKGSEKMEYTWAMKTINDSVTDVSVGIKDLNHSFYNRITAPFVTTKFRTEQVDKIKSFKTGLEDHISAFKVKIKGEGTTKETFVAYIQLKSVLQEKAQTMIMNDPIITGYLHTNSIKIIGSPYAEIVSWDKDKESIAFNYCFPISKNTKYIPDGNVKFKTIPALKGLQASYFGNFRTSDRAWFAILDYAKKNNLTVQNKVLENFLANPFNGGDESEWETKIIMPFTSK